LVFQRQTRWRSAVELLARTVSVALFVRLLLVTTQPLVRLACAALVSGVAIGLVDLLRHRPAATIPASADLVEVVAIHRTALEHQRRRFAGAWRWNIAPLLPGITLFFLAYGAAPLLWRFTACVTVALLGYVVARRSVRAAERLQAEVDTLPDVHFARWEARR
jgi:hypothetical protein